MASLQLFPIGAVPPRLIPRLPARTRPSCPVEAITAAALNPWEVTDSARLLSSGGRKDHQVDTIFSSRLAHWKHTSPGLSRNPGMVFGALETAADSRSPPPAPRTVGRAHRHLLPGLTGPGVRGAGGFPPVLLLGCGSATAGAAVDRLLVRISSACNLILVVVTARRGPLLKSSYSGSVVLESHHV